MMRLQTYAGFSFLGAIAVIYHAFSSREQFYPAMVHLSTSNICLVLLLNMGFVIMCILWQLVKRVFLGSLREAEVERLNEQSWREVMEILFAITIFRQDFSVGFLAMVTALLLIKALHWLAQKRVEYIETTPSVTMLSHIRIVSFMGFLLLVDSVFMYSFVKSLVQTWEASVMLFFSFEYMILATTTVSTFIKYVFYVSDMLMEGQWERKPVYTFYLELVRDLLHLSMYLFFFLVIFMNYGVPLHLIREFYETFRNFKIRVADYIRYRKITSNMNDRFPDATPEELTASDATCIICREEMLTAKRLRCGHLFHVQCLRSWLERQHTCPTCRSVVVPPDSGSVGSGHQHGIPAERRQPGSEAGETSARVPEGGTPTNNLSPHQVRLQAAAAAASVYQKSFVLPPTNSATWSPGFAFPPQANFPSNEVTSGSSRELAGETASSGQSQQHQSPTPNSYPYIAVAHVPYFTGGVNRESMGEPTSSGQPQQNQFPSPNVYTHIAFAQVPQFTTQHLQAQPTLENSQVEVHESLIRKQIEALQTQLQLLQQQKTENSKTIIADSVPPVANCKGKCPAETKSLSLSDCGCHGGHEEDERD